MKYMGPFLRINTLNKDNIKNQLFYLSKESLKNIVLYSKCGIPITPKQLKIKNIPHKDINIMSDFSPLLCMYKKCDSKLENDDNKFYWSNKKQKVEVEIWSNALMTLCLLELSNYYGQFKKLCDSKYLYYKLYSNLCKNQLIFYSSYLRNLDGIFVDKINSTESLSEDLKFEQKSTKFRFSNQAIVMCALYKYSRICSGKYSEEFNKFSMDILNMFLEYKNELYNQSIQELNKLCFSFNLFYDYSKNEDVKLILVDLCDLLINYYDNMEFENCKNPIEEKCLTYLNLVLAQRYVNMLNFKETSDAIFNDLIKLYNDNLGIYIPKCEDKKIKYTSVEILNYLIDIILYTDIKETDEYNFMIYNIYKYQIINSGLILSWPEIPNIDDIERYKNFSLKSDDLIDESNFIMPNIPTFKNNGLAPVFIKNIIFNKKKECFKNNRSSFYSEPNMFIFFLIIYLHNIYNTQTHECDCRYIDDNDDIEDNILETQSPPINEKTSISKTNFASQNEIKKQENTVSQQNNIKNQINIKNKSNVKDNLKNKTNNKKQNKKNK